MFGVKWGSVDLWNISSLPQHYTVSQQWRPRLESSGWRWRQNGPLKRWYPTTTLLKFIYASMQVSNISVLTLSLKFINFSFTYSISLFLKYLLVSRLTLFRLFLLVRLGLCIHCNLVCFLWSCFPCALTMHHAIKAYWVNGCIAPFILWPRH